jgi:hypothetical protein
MHEKFGQTDLRNPKRHVLLAELLHVTLWALLPGYLSPGNGTLIFYDDYDW